jgi:hypothetical protein
MPIVGQFSMPIDNMEDRYWGERALNAVKEGFLREDESQKWLEGKFRAETPVE